MSLKAELETWAAALQAYDQEDFEKSLELFSQIADSSKILTNIGLIYATLGEHEAAVEQFTAATELDQYLAVAYFQCGVSNFLLTRYDAAYNDFSSALLYLRGNQFINYEQLGLKFKLYSAEVLFNRGLTQIYMGNAQEGLADMEDARREKATEEHGVIDDAIQDRGEGYTVFSIPVGVLYRPAQKKLENSKARDFLGKAKLVAAESTNDLFTEFTGVVRLKQGVTPTNVFLEDGPTSNLSRAATVAAPSVSPADGDDPKPNLQRAKTTINVPADARERIRAANVGGAGSAPVTPPKTSPTAPAGPSLTRSATSAGAGRGPSAPLGLNGPTRGLSIRKGGSPTGPTGSAPPRGGAGARMTEFYDDYLEGYTGEEANEVPPLPEARVANWAKGVGRGGRPSAPPSSYGGSLSGGGSMRRKLTRRGTAASRGPGSRAGSSFYGGYEEEEEGYVSGEYEDMFEMVKIRVKLHYREEVRGMALLPETPFEEFMEMVTRKFGVVPGALGMKFKDEDGGKVTLRDEMDYELAIETARHSAKGRPEGRLEIWCMDE
ncbi:hypothetical protein DICSQDRAFT_73056 [Dichomitus squalens LYAD-421 SS1]|uniref:PB1 domain-containing protein n=2 Tax=Dichomitus squalens TaxID=114155 RepID=A0A4Q9MDG0_9APHY|nr:uncharacterized protein DICSQDRAFT_73056 [Dichomitus squalens LYAD-421 SS1]EJF55734.1 hypothetical protein DICSQDRAFT_73056 [Dichomitus squalens LYAD-421 SS1]TBU23846.1 hypothetical protein BD311DRAFT_673031 [Dichomitus squalens]